MSEVKFKQEIIKELSSDFDFISEVKGKHFSGKTFYIDHIIIPKDKSLWMNKNIAFGIEYKDVDRLGESTTKFTGWLGQSVDYANTDWDGYGYLYVLTCPGIRSTDFVKEVDKDFMLTRIMSEFGVGELKYLNNYGWSIVLKDKHRLWSQKNGVETCGKNWSLKRKFGSR